MDAFVHLEEQERSVAYGERFGPELVREATRRRAIEPSVPLAGIIAEDGAIGLGRTARRRRRPLAWSLAAGVEIQGCPVPIAEARPLALLHIVEAIEMATTAETA